MINCVSKTSLYLIERPLRIDDSFYEKQLSSTVAQCGAVQRMLSNTCPSGITSFSLSAILELCSHDFPDSLRMWFHFGRSVSCNN